MLNSNAALASQLPHWSTWQNNAASWWWKDKGLRACMGNVFLLYCALFTLGYDGSFISIVQGLPPWIKYFGAESGIKLGLISSAYTYPGLVFPFIGSYLSDRFGRKPIIFVASVFGIVGPIVSAFGNNRGTFIGGRVITGISAAFYQVACAPLIAEISHPRFRAKAQGTFMAVFFVGSFVAVWIGYGVSYWKSDWSWRVLTLLQCLGCVPLLVASATPYLAESPRWLVKRGRHAEGLKILARFHANGDETDELVRNEMAEVVSAIEFEGSAQKGQWSDFVSTPGNIRRLLSCIWWGWTLAMSGNALLSYYTPILVKAIGFKEPAQIQGLLAGKYAIGFLCGVLGGQLVERVGRKRLVLVGCTVTIVAQALFTGLSGAYANTGRSAIAIVAVPSLYFFSGSYVVWAFPMPGLYLPEILPFELRSKGMAIYQVCTNLGGLYNALVNPIALAAVAWKYYFLFVAIDIVEVITAYFLLVETKGLTLEDIAVLFDGENAHVAMLDDGPAIAKIEEEKPEVIHNELKTGARA